MKCLQARNALPIVALLYLLGGIGIIHLPTASGQTQAQMNQTAGKDFGKADKAMNVAYKKLMDKLDNKGKVRLKKAQIAWLKFRDAEADFLSYDVEEGSIYGTIHPMHMQELTEKRTKELKAAYKQFITEGSN